MKIIKLFKYFSYLFFQMSIEFYVIRNRPAFSINICKLRSLIFDDLLLFLSFAG